MRLSLISFSIFARSLWVLKHPTTPSNFEFQTHPSKVFDFVVGFL